jgi:myo-inositol-1(or 4)-monophosphatase
METLARPTHLDVALGAVHAAAKVIRQEFSERNITAYKGRRDIQLAADLLAQEEIIKHLSRVYPDYGIVAEEGEFTKWPGERFVWAIDPLDGTNNFGYGIAHCAEAITLFDNDDVILAVIHDPITGRTFHRMRGREETSALPTMPLRQATVSLVTGYPEAARSWGQAFERWIDGRCKRVLNLWAPALDLALVSTGAIDAMVCKDAALLDVCAGMYLVESSGGTVLGLDGKKLKVDRRMHDRPVSFVASGDPRLASELARQARQVDGHSGSGYSGPVSLYDRDRLPIMRRRSSIV